MSRPGRKDGVLPCPCVLWKLGVTVCVLLRMSQTPSPTVSVTAWSAARPSFLCILETPGRSWGRAGESRAASLRTPPLDSSSVARAAECYSGSASDWAFCIPSAQPRCGSPGKAVAVLIAKKASVPEACDISEGSTHSLCLCYLSLSE